MDQRIVVSNTTPLIALAWLEKLALLPHLFGQVHIPQAVYDEIHYQPEAIGVAELRDAPWLVTCTITNTIAPALLLDQLDKGETEAIILAHELQAGLLLMDERRGRRRALQSGLTLVGTLGILIQARQLQLIGPIQPLLVKLQQLPFHIHPTLYAEVLKLAGESDK